MKEKKKKTIEIKKHNTKTIKDKIIRDIRTRFEKEEDYYEPKRVGNFWNDFYFEYESNAGKNRDFSLGEYLN